MAGRLDGKVAVITGACSGIGLGSVELFVAEGATVIAADIQDDKGAILEQRFPDRLRYIRCDVTKEADLHAALAAAVEAFGGLDILFSNAGHGGPMASLEETDADAWDRTFALLVRAPALGIKHAAPLMRARGGGAIVNTASVAGLQAGFGPPAYSAAKAAVIQLTRTAAAELSPSQIRVNALCPGLIATPIFGVSLGFPREMAEQMAARIEEAAPKMQPIPKAGLPNDIAEAALFLASDASVFVTGTHLVVDGGLTVGPPSAWSKASLSPLMQALGVTPEQAEAFQAMQKAQKGD